MADTHAPDRHAPVTAPASWYTDSARWPVERQKIFASAWQFLCHDSDLAAPGAYRDITIRVIALHQRGLTAALHQHRTTATLHQRGLTATLHD